jgi:membrane protease YdiL (CAAX protease family)
LWVAAGLIMLLVAYCVLSAASVVNNAKARASARQQFETYTALMPHTRVDLYRFGGVALTAGFCEEFLYRGYLIWVFAPWLGWWGAAALSVVIFAGAHAYQGSGGVIRTGLVAVVFTMIVAALGSLWPAIVLHFVLDLGMGIVAWLALRDGPATNGEVDVVR